MYTSSFLIDVPAPAVPEPVVASAVAFNAVFAARTTNNEPE